tara:strand:+ start:587 stop:1969 length:1383 start_codon:yes stop_codon:yes gene_type:complete
MAQSIVNIGTIADDGTGDTIRGAGIKINANFTELFARPSVISDINVIQNNITTNSSNADINIIPAGTGSVRFPGLTIDDNEIKATRTNDDLKIIPNGSGSVVIDGIGFSGTSIVSPDSTIINVNENLIVDGSLNVGASTFTSPVSVSSTLGVSSTTTLSTLTVSGASSFVGTTTVDNLLFNDNIISSSSNADINLTPGGTGVVNVSNLTIDSSINLTDNVIKVTRSNDNFLLTANGTGSVQVSKIDLNSGTVDNTVIGATTPAAGTFTTISITNPTISADGVTITDNEVKANRSNDDVEFAASGTGNVIVSGLKFPNADGSANQVFKTDGSGTISYFTSPILFDVSDLTDGTATVSGGSSAVQVIDTFAHATFRSAKYILQISDATADRYRIIEANVTHNGSNAFVSIFSGVDNGNSDGSSVYDTLDISADISGANVRLLGTVNNTNNQVVKFVRRPIKV